MHDFFQQEILSRLPEIQAWVSRKSAVMRTPFYSSVDIRYSGFKIAGVDTNLFPAGFNNLDTADFPDFVARLQNRILADVPGCRNILLITEEHTRNPWYLDNIHVLSQQIEAAGFHVRMATFLNDDPEFCKDSHSLVLPSASGAMLRLECLHYVVNELASGAYVADAVLLNNDLSIGIPAILSRIHAPVLTPAAAGWHARGKSQHFSFANGLIRDMCADLGLDPWLFSAYFVSVSDVNIHEDSDRRRISEAAEILFEKIAKKYEAYGITEKPFVFMKSDSGTYGMGIHVLESPAEIQDINRKVRNKLHKGKHSQVIGRYLLQEGVPSVVRHQGHMAEPCCYHVGSDVVGGFLRIHPERSARENLNAAGMTFSPIGMSDYAQSFEGVIPNWRPMDVKTLFSAISTLAALAAGQELDWL
jgi:glutamate--cysteine ligase